MNQASTAGWSPMVAGPDEEFANFLEFGDLQLPFNPLDGLDQSNGKPPGQNADMAIDIPMDPNMDTSMNMFGFDDGQVHQQHQIPQDHLPSPAPTDQNANLDFYSMPSFRNMAVQQHHQQQAHQNLQMKHREFYGHPGIPPTPKSMEMNGGPVHYYPSPSMYPEQTYEHLRQRQRNNMIFTPLVSPAVTPLDTQFRRVEHQVPGEHFSPLTSPALAGQTPAPPRSSTLRSSDTSDTTSPIELDPELGNLPNYPEPKPVRKSRRKTIPTPKSASRSVKQSPIMKSQSRRKQASTSKLTPKEISTIMETAERAKPTGVTPITAAIGKLPLPYSLDSSEADSVSPEPLSEVLMPPPATPRSSSAGKSPHIAPTQAELPAEIPVDSNGEPATPASLMRIEKSKSKVAGKQQNDSRLKEQTLAAEAEMEQILDDITLPDPVKGSTRPVLSPIDTVNANDSEITPTLPARRTPHATASAPLTATSSIFPSPRDGPTTTPLTSTLPSKRFEPSKVNGRESKKRHSNSSSQVSPAIRPKISPSIKPLLPEGTIVSPETSALLLASKSNYQNILEGTHLPGVSYPETLSTNLTSKRTSHKIAEQGRRNRINLALQEIASLLPPQPSPTVNGTGSSSTNGSKSPGEDKAGSGGDATAPAQQTAAQQSNSKASTVEMAIEYIKSLQSQLKTTNEKLEVAEQKLVDAGVVDHEQNAEEGTV